MRKPIPFYIEELAEDIADIQRNTTNENTVTFAFITDTHHCVDYTERCLYAIREIDKKYPVAFTCLGGDYLCNNDRTSKALALEQHSDLGAVIQAYAMHPPVMVIKGNHDDNPFGELKNRVREDELYDILMPHHAKLFVGNPNAPKSLYGYYDVPEKKLRAIFINPMDDIYETDENGTVTAVKGGNIIRNEQLNWIAHEALKMPGEGWGVVLFSHFPVMPTPFRESSARTFAGDALWDILLAFRDGQKLHVCKETGSASYDVTVDFTAQGPCEVLGFYCGHCHTDWAWNQEGIPVFCLLSAASDNYETSRCQDGTYHNKVRGSAQESAFTLITIDRAAKKISCVRGGAGNSFSVRYGTRKDG